MNSHEILREATGEAWAPATQREPGTAAMLAALERAADIIKQMDGGDPSEETGWASQEALDAWLIVRAAIDSATL